MNRFVRLVALALVVASPLGAAAQDLAEPRPVPNPFRIGVGGSFEFSNAWLGGNDDLALDDQAGFADAFLPTSFTDLTVPMWIGEHLRIEPHVGWFHLGDEFRETFEGELTERTEVSISAFRIGTGVA